MEIAALSLSVSVVSLIFNLLGDKVAPFFGGDITEKELQHLQNIILPKIRTVLRVAKEVRVHELKPWLRTLQAAVYEAEDVLDMYEYKRLQAQVCSLPESLKKQKKAAKDFSSPLSLKTELKISMEKLRQSADEADKLISLYGTIIQTPLLRDTMQQQQPRQQLHAISSTSSPFFGRDDERKKLVNMLISTTNEPSSSEMLTPILAIRGIGGAGKTALAQSVYNDSRVQKHFHKRMWIYVSRKFDALKITTEIIQSATKGRESYKDITSLDALQARLKEILKSKKFLVVLDDVWCEDSMQWDQMLVPLNEVGHTKSRILVTTRTEKVASILGIENVVQLKDLKAEDCMSIFKHYSLGNADKVIDDPEIADIVEKMMMKLKKSPLSARIMGSSLRKKTNVNDWKYILREDKMLNGTLDVLYLSFENLEPHLQRCFAICSLYPKSYWFDQEEVDRLVKFWIAQSFVEIPDNDNMTIEDKGGEYFKELLSHSFFKKETEPYYGDYYVIHDLLHDLAEDVSKGHCFRIEDDNSRIPPTVMHLSIFRMEDLSSDIKSDIFKLLNLRTFIIYEISKADFNSIFDARSKIFEKFKKLRVLYLVCHRLSELHKSVGQLKHLRYFEFSGSDQLPESLGRLYHLQVLKLGRSWANEKVPENLNNLINLRFLDAKDEIISKIPFIGRLTSLQNIEQYRASRKRGHGVGELKNLRGLRGSLSIDNLENVKNKAEASEASLNEKKLLEELSLEWAYSPERDGKIDEEVIEGLEPSPNLNEVKISGYNGIELPKWLRFLRLTTLSIKDCDELKQVPSLPSTLKTVVIENCKNLCKASSLPPALRVVTVRECPKLKQVPSLPSTLKTVVIENCKDLCEAPSLPRDLRDLTVKECPKLMQLCPFPPNLEYLEIKGCPGVETLLADVLLFDSRDEQQPNHQLQQQLQLKTLSIKNCSVSGGKKRHFGSRNNKLFSSLSQVTLWDLPWLASLLLPDLTSLEDVSTKNCENLELFGSSLASASSLRSLDISDCPRLTMQSDMDGSFDLLPSPVDELHLHNCGDPEMNLLERCLRGLNSLTELHVGGYSDALSLPDLANPGAIQYLCVCDCPELATIWNLQRFASLKDLRVMGCPKLIVEGGEPLVLPPSLARLAIDDLSLLAAPLLRSPCLNSLSTLTIRDWEEGIAFTREQEEELFPHLTSVTSLEIRDCPNLTSLPASLEKLSSLRKLVIRRCPKIESLPNLPTSLRCLDIVGYHPHLKVSYGEGGPLHHKVQHIPYFDIESQKIITPPN